jgi:hypothetical protein
MRKIFLMRSLHLLYIGLSLTGATLQGVVNWSGGPQATDVIDQDLNISGDNQIVGGVRIVANAVDVTVNVTAGNAIVRGTPSGPSRLFLLPSAGRTITFNLQDTLSFFGSATGPQLLVYVDGGGLVQFQVNDNEAVVFGADVTGSGTAFYLNMRQSSPSSVLFTRLNAASGNNADIIVGADSIISYVAQTPVSSGTALEVGAITFDPTNSGTGRLRLFVDNTGTFLIAGNLIDPSLTPPFIFLTNIHLDTPAGLNAQAVVVNSSGPTETAGLLVVNSNQVYPNLVSDPFCTLLPFDGFRAGFILGANATLSITDNSYFDYVGAATNTCLNPPTNREFLEHHRHLDELIKPRNASAFIVDGNRNPNAVPAHISFGSSSALYFRSGVDRHGNIENFDGYDFAVSPRRRTDGTGNFVFDVEGRLNVDTTVPLNTARIPASNAIEIFSLYEAPTGGSVRSDTNETDFPLRTFARDFDGRYIMYNCAAFLINDRVNLFNVTLDHTDACHKVFENNDVLSEPTYVGGERVQLCHRRHRPTIAFYNSQLYVQTDIAFTGVDLLVPFNNLPEGNQSDFQFFQDGNRDNCTGRQMVLGTLIGSRACDSCSIVSSEAHLDIYAESVATTTNSLSAPHTLLLTTTTNNNKVIENLPDGLDLQYSLQNIYLGWASNISIGNDSNVIFGTTPTLNIDGNYFSFSTRGGLNCTPSTSNVTGQGGIFVDRSGVLTINQDRRATIATMVTKSRGGVIDLPAQNVYFNLKVGIADWHLDLTDPAQRIIVSEGQTITDYTLNWLATKKDYANWSPYNVPVPAACACPPVTTMNISSLPTVQGTVDQFQIQGSRFSCPASFLIDSGFVRELVFLKGCNAGEEATAVVVLQNEGQLGIGTALADHDSTYADIRLGINGLQIIADGDCQLTLNQDVRIDNICAFLRGPDFSTTGTNSLRITSHGSKTIRVTPTGVLDLSSFSNSTDTITFEGDIILVFEPGSRLILGGATLQFFNSAGIIIEPYFGYLPLSGTSVTASDDRRVRFVGTGGITFNDQSYLDIERHAYLGIENLVGDTSNPVDRLCNINFTDLTFNLAGDAQVFVGDGFTTPGGIFQVGNTSETGGTVNFTLTINGEEPKFIIGLQGMLGLGVGIANDVSDIPNNWLVDTLFDVGSISFTVLSGSFEHSNIFSGDNPNASLLALGPTANGYNFTFNELNGELLGGGNFISILPLSIPLNIPGTAISPTVLSVDFTSTSTVTGRLSTSIMSSTPLLRDISGDIKPSITNPVNQNALFAYLKVADTSTVSNTRGVAAGNNSDSFGVEIAYVSNSTIIRRLAQSIIGPNGEPISSNDTWAAAIGAVQLLFPGADPQAANEGPILFEIPQVGTHIQ